jgi:hypothetical protein
VIIWTVIKKNPDGGMWGLLRDNSMTNVLYSNKTMFERREVSIPRLTYALKNVSLALSGPVFLFVVAALVVVYWIFDFEEMFWIEKNRN